MKKLVACIIVAALVCAGCGSNSDKWVQENASEDVRPYAEQAINIIDEYLAFEISSEEATKSFSELYKRISSLDISGTNSDYNDQDLIISHSIRMLSIGQINSRSDIELYEYRDTIAFQIVKPTSGKVYEANRNVFNYIYNEDGDLIDDPDAEENLSKFLSISSVPFSSASADEDLGYWHISIYFDAKNGVGVSSIQKYIKNIYTRFRLKGLTTASVTVHYEKYEQPVFSIHLSIDDGNVYGSVARDNAQYFNMLDKFHEKYTVDEIVEMKEYPKEFAILNPLYKFDSIDDLSQAIKIASAFAGESQ